MPNKLYEVTVDRGEDIKSVLTAFVLANGWQNVYVTGAIGSVIDMVFTTPVENTLPLRCGKVPVSAAGEIVQFCGEIMPREKMPPELENIYPDKTCPLFVHIHAACAIAGGHVIGGGLSAGKAFRALRIFMLPLDA